MSNAIDLLKLLAQVQAVQENTESKKACSNCKYADFRYAAYPICKRYPPQPLGSQDKNGAIAKITQGVRVTVTADDWCGEFQEKQQKQENILDQLLQTISKATTGVSITAIEEPKAEEPKAEEPKAEEPKAKRISSKGAIATMFKNMGMPLSVEELAALEATEELEDKKED
jgi:hypothetical protein